MEISGIITHTGPHLDDITAIWELKEFGEKKYPGVSTAEIIFWAAGGNTPDGRSAAAWEEEGFLLVGTGGGKLDDHPRHNGSGPSSKKECAATLVAKDLGIDDDPALRIILEAVKKEDLNAGSQALELGPLVKLLHAQFPVQPEKVIEWTIMGLEAKYYEQAKFFEEATRREFEAEAKVTEVVIKDKPLLVVTIVSDNELMAKFARSSAGCKAAVVIQKHSSGNVQIFSSKRFGITLFDVAQMINLAEQKAEGEVKITNWKTLVAEGMIPNGKWHFHYKGQMLLNGSLSAPDVPPTRIPLERITEIVAIGINPGIFELEHAPRCKEGICTSTRNKQCLWYAWGLSRCRTIRFKMKKKQT